VVTRSQVKYRLLEEKATNIVEFELKKAVKCTQRTKPKYKIHERINIVRKFNAVMYLDLIKRFNETICEFLKNKTNE